MPRPRVGVIARPQLAPEQLVDAARGVQEAGLDELWLWEDCFWTGGLTTATAALAGTTSIRVGLMPAPFRNPALAAMEIATLARLYPGRFVPTLGHGVLDWMAQVGARVSSPLTLLRETATAVRSLLHGDEVSTAGDHVRLDAVRLDHPPVTVPPLLLGARGRRTLRLAGEVADGVVLDGSPTAETVAAAVATVREGRAAPGAPVRDLEVVVTPSRRPIPPGRPPSWWTPARRRSSSSRRRVRRVRRQSWPRRSALGPPWLEDEGHRGPHRCPPVGDRAGVSLTHSPQESSTFACVLSPGAGRGGWRAEIAHRFSAAGPQRNATANRRQPFRRG